MNCRQSRTATGTSQVRRNDDETARVVTVVGLYSQMRTLRSHPAPRGTNMSVKNRLI